MYGALNPAAVSLTEYSQNSHIVKGHRIPALCPLTPSSSFIILQFPQNHNTLSCTKLKKFFRLF